MQQANANPMLNATPPNAIFTNPNTESVVIDDIPKPKSRKWVIAGIITFLTLIIAGTIIAIISTSNNPNTATQTSALQNSFTKFANYVLFNKESDEALSSSTEPYAIELNHLNETDGKTFLSNAKSLFDDYLKAINESPKNEELDLSPYNLAIETDLDFLILVSSRPLINNSDVISYYLASGRDGVIEVLNSYYSNQTKLSLREFASAEIEAMNSKLDHLTFYENNGCLADGNIDQTCVQSLTLPDELQAKSAAIENFYNTVLNEIIDSEANIVSNTLTIIELLET